MSPQRDTVENEALDNKLQRDGVCYTTKRMLSKSLSYFNTGCYRDALNVCEELYILKTSNIENLIRLGALHLQLRNFHESIFYCNQCLRLESQCPEAYSIIGSCHKELGDTDAARASFEKAIKIHPNFADAHNNRACFLFQTGKYHEALDSLKVAAVLDPSHSDVLCNMGSVYKSLAQYEEAKSFFFQAIQVNPNCAIAWSNLGGVLNENGQHKKAIDCYCRALQIMPAFADAYSNMGNAMQILSAKKSIDSMQEVYERAVELKPNFAKGLGNLAVHDALDGKPINEITKKLREALRFDPNHIDALNNLAGIYYEKGLVDDCVKMCLNVLQKKPDHVQCYNILGNALQKKVHNLNFFVLKVTFISINTIALFVALTSRVSWELPLLAI